MVSSLMVIPVACAVSKSYFQTVIYSICLECYLQLQVLLSHFIKLKPGGTMVLTRIAMLYNSDLQNLENFLKI